MVKKSVGGIVRFIEAHLNNGRMGLALSIRVTCGRDGTRDTMWFQMIRFTVPTFRLWPVA